MPDYLIASHNSSHQKRRTDTPLYAVVMQKVQRFALRCIK
jgi:hypothetical protein